MKNCFDMPIFLQCKRSLLWLFVSEREQIALMADANLIFASPLRDKSLRNGDYHGKKHDGVWSFRKGNKGI